MTAATWIPSSTVSCAKARADSISSTGSLSIAVTFDLYGHLFPGNESEAAALLDAFLDRAFLK